MRSIRECTALLYDSLVAKIEDSFSVLSPGQEVANHIEVILRPNTIARAERWDATLGRQTRSRENIQSWTIEA
jgi:hypothetical protein